MLSLGLIALILGCTPDPTMTCTRELAPVCAGGSEYGNLCQAQAAGYTGECAKDIVNGPCTNLRSDLPTVPEGLDCAATETYSETGRCVDKPWSDFRSCAEEKRQGACPNGNDPNPWVGEHCLRTCAA